MRQVRGWTGAGVLALTALCLAACGGGSEMTGVLAPDVRQQAAGVMSGSSGTIEIPARVRGASSVEDYLVQSARAALDADAGSFGTCSTRQIARRSQSYKPFEGAILDVLERNGAQKAWRTKIHVGGCASPRRHNILIVTYDDQPTTFIALVPGSTKADLPTQRKASQLVYETLGKAVDSIDCRDSLTRIRDTRFEKRFEESASSREMRVWSETWIAQYCARDYEVPLTFFPQKEGAATISVTGEVTPAILKSWPRL